MRDDSPEMQQVDHKSGVTAGGGLLRKIAMLLLRRANRKDVRADLLRKMRPGGVCAEIGVFRGDFSERILQIARPRRLHLVDPWKYEPEAAYEQSLYGSSHAEGQPGMDAMFNSVRERFKNEIQLGTVVLNRSASAEAAGQFDDGYFDWVYIDGNHLYEFVLRDLESYYPKVKAGGYITGDDYGSEGWWKGGVTKAVEEFVVRGGCEYRLTRGSQFLLRKNRR